MSGTANSILRLCVVATVTIVLASCNNGQIDESDADPLPVVADSLLPAQAALRPVATLATLKGDSLSISDFRGRHVLVNFWATWCPPCREEMPDLIALHEQFSSRDFSVVGISVDLEGPDVVQAFVDEYQVPFPIALGGDGVAEAFGGAFALPTSFLLNPAGEVVGRFPGVFPAEMMAGEFDELLPPA